MSGYTSELSSRLYNININAYINLFAQYEEIINVYSRNQHSFPNNTEAMLKINELRNLWKTQLSKNNFNEINSYCSMMMIVLTLMAEVMNGNIDGNNLFQKKAIVMTRHLTKTNPEYKAMSINMCEKLDDAL